MKFLVCQNNEKWYEVEAESHQEAIVKQFGIWAYHYDTDDPFWLYEHNDIFYEAITKDADDTLRAFQEEELKS